MRNIALNRPATQSSTSKWSTSQDRQVDASVANNGDLISQRWFHTEEELNPWWQVDLETPSLIQEVVIHNRADQAPRLARFKLLRSNDGSEYFEFYHKSDASVFSDLVIPVREGVIARYIRVQLLGRGYLHFRECEVFGSEVDVARQRSALREDQESARLRMALPDGRQGIVSAIGSFHVFVDEIFYGEKVQCALKAGNYEARERDLVSRFIKPGDRVLEVGTAVGIVSMTAAAIVGAENVTTFEANPDLVSDAQANFLRNGLSGIRSHAGILANKTKFRDGAQLDFHISRDFWASRLDAGQNKSDIVRTVKVPMYCFEKEIEQNNVNVLCATLRVGRLTY